MERKELQRDLWKWAKGTPHTLAKQLSHPFEGNTQGLGGKLPNCIMQKKLGSHT